MSECILPELGLGTYRMKGETCVANVCTAIKLGYRLIDTARVYRNEQEVGQGIINSGVSRDELFITSKLKPADMKSVEKTRAAVLESLQALQVSYIDLYLIHWPAVNRLTKDSPKHRAYRLTTWRVLETLQREGRIRYIGVSNFNISHLEQLIEDGISVIPQLNQVEFHPFCFQQPLLSFCHTHGTHIYTTLHDPYLYHFSSNVTCLT